MQPRSQEELQVILENHGISTTLWGQGNAKTPDHLLGEIRVGEAKLVIAEGRLVREIAVVCLDITRGGAVLKEAYQLFYQGARKRVRTLDATTGEKLLPGETPEEGVRRLIATEFPVLLLQPAEAAQRVGTRYRESESASYPGLMTRYQLHFFTVELAADPPPFTVMEHDKLTAYHWIQPAEEPDRRRNDPSRTS